MATIIDSGWYMPHKEIAEISVGFSWHWMKYCDAWRYKGVPAPMTIYAIDRGCKCTWTEGNEDYDFSKCKLHSKKEFDTILNWLADDPTDKPVA